MKRKSDPISNYNSKRIGQTVVTTCSSDSGNEVIQCPINRCWASDDNLLQEYHDNSWGRPETDESRLFESQTLQLMQCGVSWTTVWRKRENFRRAFKNYDVAKVAGFTEKHVDDLLALPPGTIIRNRSKIRAVVENARLILSFRMDAASCSCQSFADFLWGYCPTNEKERLKSIESVSGSHMRSARVDPSSYETRDASDGVHPSKTVCALSRELKRRGFGFMGPTTVLSFMQVCHQTIRPMLHSTPCI
jgi:DNA-3-methyladenine glycosylase I